MTFPGSPKLLKGAIVGFDVMNPVASIIIFQYNPKNLSRTLQARTAGEGNKREAQRLTGPPTETISLEADLDAADQLETGDPIAATMGIHPQLAAMEMLIYPKMIDVIMRTALLAAGTIEVMQSEAPFTLFVWGPARVLPVRVKSFSVAEEEFDPKLNPIRAKVSLGLDVLSYNDFSVLHPGYYTFMAHHALKEAMAVVGSVGNVAGAISGSVSASVSIG